VSVLDLFADHSDVFRDIMVCDETYLDVHHYLLGCSSDRLGLNHSSASQYEVNNVANPRARPLTSLHGIERIYSHPQAFGQCEQFLGAYLKGVERIDVSSTSKAAELVKMDTSGTSVAIASSLAAKMHGLAAFAEGIEDSEDNTTRFLVLKRRAMEATHEIEVSTNHNNSPSTKNLVSFTVDHRSPGALADVLDCFRRHQLNLTSINSRPSRLRPFQYIFFVEFRGSQVNDQVATVKGALDDLSKVARRWRWLGSWEDKLP
jgi:prephenate dehydratase